MDELIAEFSAIEIDLPLGAIRNKQRLTPLQGLQKSKQLRKEIDVLLVRSVHMDTLQLSNSPVNSPQTPLWQSLDDYDTIQPMQDTLLVTNNQKSRPLSRIAQQVQEDRIRRAWTTSASHRVSQMSPQERLQLARKASEERAGGME